MTLRLSFMPPYWPDLAALLPLSRAPSPWYCRSYRNAVHRAAIVSRSCRVPSVKWPDMWPIFPTCGHSFADLPLPKISAGIFPDEFGLWRGDLWSCLTHRPKTYRTAWSTLTRVVHLNACATRPCGQGRGCYPPFSRRKLSGVPE